MNIQKIDTIKPTIDLIGRSTISSVPIMVAGTTNTQYNANTVTYNDINQIYGGTISTDISYIDFKPIINILDNKVTISSIQNI